MHSRINTPLSLNYLRDQLCLSRMMLIRTINPVWRMATEPIGLCSQVGFDSEFMFIKSVTQQDYYNVSLSRKLIFSCILHSTLGLINKTFFKPLIHFPPWPRMYNIQKKYFEYSFGIVTNLLTPTTPKLFQSCFLCLMMLFLEQKIASN